MCYEWLQCTSAHGPEANNGSDCGVRRQERHECKTWRIHYVFEKGWGDFGWKVSIQGRCVWSEYKIPATVIYFLSCGTSSILSFVRSRSNHFDFALVFEDCFVGQCGSVLSVHGSMLLFFGAGGSDRRPIESADPSGPASGGLKRS